MSKHLITIAEAEHGVISAHHDGLDQQYCEAGETVTIKNQPDAGWGLQAVSYTTDGNTYTAITGGTFTMPSSDITIVAVFKRFVIGDWTDGQANTDAEIFAKGANGEPMAVTIQDLVGVMADLGVFFPTPVYENTVDGTVYVNTYNDFGTLTANKTFELGDAAENGLSHYYWVFETGSTAPTITFPAEITAWVGGSAPVVAANSHYEISVIDGIGAYLEVAL